MVGAGRPGPIQREKSKNDRIKECGLAAVLDRKPALHHMHRRERDDHLEQQKHRDGARRQADDEQKAAADGFAENYS